ncbi:MAG: hypothetical protein PHS99_05785 [Candidatus Marinimicrobia bacterium]|nr:hypothetical protein [Candidatus Neomarinimicrobiota bacterium]
MEISLMGFLLAALSGLSLSLIGIAFKLGQSKNVVPLHIATSIGICGMIFFGIQANWTLMKEIPLFIYGLALINALGQIIAMELTKASLKRGPLSPVWCALNLNFLVVIIYAAVVYNETIHFFQILALVSGLLCVLAASNLGNDENEKGKKGSLKDKFLYGFMLIIILFSNSIVFLTIRDLGSRMIPGENATYLGKYLPNIYFILYAMMAIVCGAVVSLQKVKPESTGSLIKLGLMGGVGSIAGLFLLSLCARYPAAFVFTINGMITILAGTLASSFFFGEKRTLAWYLTISFGILAVILANLN